ncbi:MAG: CocE/NonD family hydrolase [Pseudomonadota bacterium]
MKPALRDDRGRPRRFWSGIVRHPLVSVILVGWLAACSSNVHTPYVPGSVGPAGPLPAIAQPIAAQTLRFDYPRMHALEGIVDQPDGETGDYWVRQLQMVSSGGPERQPVRAHYYQGKEGGAKPLVIVLPVWGVSSYPSNAIARGLRAHNEGTVNILLVDGEELLFDWDRMAAADDQPAFDAELSLMVERFTHTVIDIRRLVDWAQGQPEIDPTRIAIVGFSMSAIVGSVVLTNDPRVDYGVLVVGGGDLHEVLAVCNGRIRRTRETLMERFDWTVEDFKERLKAPLDPINPVHFGGRQDPAGLLVIEAAEDSCVPESARERFWEAMGRPERISYQYGHRATFLALTFLGGHDMQHRVFGFLDRALAPSWPRYQAAQITPAP